MNLFNELRPHVHKTVVARAIDKLRICVNTQSKIGGNALVFQICVYRYAKQIADTQFKSPSMRNEKSRFVLAVLTRVLIDKRLFYLVTYLPIV